MPVVRTRVVVTAEGAITGRAPRDVPPGEHTATISVEEHAGDRGVPWDLPVDDCGPWPPGLTLRREEIYDEDGR